MLYASVFFVHKAVSANGRQGMIKTFCISIMILMSPAIGGGEYVLGIFSSSSSEYVSCDFKFIYTYVYIYNRTKHTPKTMKKIFP